jgi:hypothetical protein
VPGHDITPVKGSARRVRDGTPADLTSLLGYPAEALCLECGQPIRTERYWFSKWIHITRFSAPES